MEVLYTAKRINNTTSLRWFVFNDDVYSGIAITNDGDRVKVDEANIQQYYENPIDIKFSHKRLNVTYNKKKDSTPTTETSDALKKKKLKKEKARNTTDNVEIIDEGNFPKSETLSAKHQYHKMLYMLKSESTGFEIEVDGNEQDALTLKNELSKRHNDLELIKKTIRTTSVVVDKYTTIEHYRNGKLLFEMDFDDPKDASAMYAKRLSNNPNDDIRIHHVEEVI